MPVAGDTRRARLLAFVALLAAALLVQWMAGAYTSEMTVGADDPAHFVSALMVHDWLIGGPADHPVAYAREYYAHYPKLGIGNWPPLFHVVQAAWMLPFPETGASVMALMALLTATTAWLVYVTLRRPLGAAFAALGAAFFLAMRPLPELASSVMAEVPTTLACTAAALAWIRVVEHGGARRIAVFAAAVVVAILTKANGLLLLLLPPLSIVIGGYWRLLRSRALWSAALVALAVTAPALWWMLPTMRAGWGNRDDIFGDVGEATAYYLVQLPRWAGVATIALAVIGIVAAFEHSWRPGTRRAIWVTAAAMVAATLVFHALAPAGVAMRHMLPAYPFVAMLAAAGTHRVATALQRRGVRAGRATAVAVGAAALALAVEQYPIRDEHLNGFAAAAEAVTAPGTDASAVVLVSSDPTGEGAMVAELAMRDAARPSHVVWRATKLLATVTWAGRDYSERAATDAELVRLLELAAVDWVVVDRSRQRFPHQHSIERAIASHGDRFALRAAIDVRRNREAYPDGLLVYAFDRSGVAPTDSLLRQVPGYEGIGLAGRAAATR